MKLIKEAITLPTTYSLHPEATSYVAGLMLESQSIELPIPAPARAEYLQIQQHAVIMGREFRKHLSEVEETRKALKAPLLAAERLLDSIASNHTQPMIDEVARLEDVAARVNELEKKHVAAQEAARAAEIAKLEEQRLQAAQAAQVATAAATGAPRVCTDSLDGQHSFTPDLNQDPTGKTINCEYCGTPAEQAEADADQAEADIAAENAQAAAEAAEEAVRAAIVKPMPEVSKPKGLAVSQNLKWEVTDIDALYRARPELCKPPTPKPSAIKSTCSAPASATAQDPDTQIPGLKLWWEDDTTIRK